MADRPRAALFDIDGTLVDSNYLHVEAWHRAFQTFGSPVDAWRIHRDIGMDADQMLADLLGIAAEPIADDLKQEHARLFRQSADRLRAFDGVRELLLEMTDAGVSVVLATSASSEELELLLETIDVDRDRFATTNADDVAIAKPHPGIIDVALNQARVEPGQALFVGDTVWDMLAATRAGVPAVGVRTGGIGTTELMQAGARRVLESVAELSASREGPRAGIR